MLYGTEASPDEHWIEQARIVMLRLAEQYMERLRPSTGSLTSKKWKYSAGLRG
jgi:hypothetical protein